MFREDYIKDNNFLSEINNTNKVDFYEEIENSKIKLNALYENLNFVTR